MTEFGPFSVAPAVIRGLGGANFGRFVSRLLGVEIASSRMAGTSLETTYLENVGDGGVDAALRQAESTKWVPSGDSAWQFKAGDLTPSKCEAELDGATFAKEIVNAGGKYRLVLGASLTSAQISARRNALIQKAKALGFSIDVDSFEIITADGLARWAEQHPSLAVDPILGGIGSTCLTFATWSDSNRHATTWVSSQERDQIINQLRDVVSGGEQLDVHVDGVSGLGKTRLVMEALRGQPCEPIVVYVPAADQVTATLLNQLMVQERIAVLVVDECDRKQHEIYASALPNGTRTRLVTIGEPGSYSTRSPMIGLRGLDDMTMTDLLRSNVPNLWPEATRVVVGVSAGNVDYALKAARAILSAPSSSAASLVTADDVRTYITGELPDGALFLGCAALALFSRFGFDSDVSFELDLIGEGLGISTADLRTAALALQGRGLLSKQGRFRSVGPYPVAVYLAARGWEVFGERIVSQLLPGLDHDLAERLFRRAADIGEFDSSSPALTAVLAADGPLASLDSIAEASNSKLLVHFAVLAPSAVAGRLTTLVEEASDEDLASHESIRRDLVWTLEKLAWHTQTFERAADSLLKLALVETESYSNNATGTWIGLFGTMLPATGASPEMRMAYLAGAAIKDDGRVKAQAVRGAEQALSSQQSVMVSGELQGGSIVEPRGAPANYGEVWRYRNAAVDVLRLLSDDSKADVAEAALKVLTASIHPSLEQKSVRSHLAEALSSLSPGQLRYVRTEIASLKALFGRVEDAEDRLEALNELEANLPIEGADDKLWTLARTYAWDRESGQLQQEILATVNLIEDASPVETLLGLLEEEIPAAFEVGYVLANLASDLGAPIERLRSQVNGPNAAAVVGFLWGRTDAGEEEAFDEFIDKSSLGAAESLRLSVRGPKSARSLSRVDSLVPKVSVQDGAQVLFGWLQDATDGRFEKYLTSWVPRIARQADYNAVVDFLATHLSWQGASLPDIERVSRELIAQRADFPNVGQQAWDWARLAMRQVEHDPRAIANLLADLTDAGAVNVFPSSHEGEVLRAAVERGGAETWTGMMTRVESGSWRLSLSTRGWLGQAAGLEPARAWVGTSLERARTLASVASIGDEQVSPVARFLLDTFGSDQQVASALVGEFVSGSWTGNQSDRISGQIDKLNRWISNPSETRAVRAWARRLVTDLETDRVKALEREAERGW